MSPRPSLKRLDPLAGRACVTGPSEHRVLQPIEAYTLVRTAAIKAKRRALDCAEPIKSAPALSSSRCAASCQGRSMPDRRNWTARQDCRVSINPVGHNDTSFLF